MPFTLVSLIREATLYIGLPQPSAAIGSADRSIVQLVGFANSIGRRLVKTHIWRQLKRAGTITTVATQEAYPLPADWGRQIPETEWDQTLRWPVTGPYNSQEWGILKYGYPSSIPYVRFRIFGSSFVLDPVPAASGRLIQFEYVSNRWVLDSGSTPKAAFSADDDTCIFDDELMIIGLRLWWQRAKGFDSTIEQNEFDDLLSVMKAQDASSRTLSLSPRSRSFLLDEDNLPDTGYTSV